MDGGSHVSAYKQWLQLSSQVTCIGAILLTLWAIPLFVDNGLMMLLPLAFLVVVFYSILAAFGCLVIYFDRQ